MQAWRIHAYGGPEALRLDTLAVPEPGPGEVLIHVHAASVNPIDWKLREGRLQRGTALTLPAILGRDCAGVVVMGTGFAPGERVLGVAAPGKDGTHAQYAVVPAATSARIPVSVSFEEAVAFGVAGTSAWIPMVEIAKVGPGMRVLVHAGAGGVGSIAIQLARHLGAEEIVTTCGPKNIDLVRSLGAHRVIDYTKHDFVQGAGPCDVVFDTVAGEVHRRSFEVLKPGGLLVYVNGGPLPEPPRKDVRVEAAQIRATTERLEKLVALAASGDLRGVVGQAFAFSETPAAYAAVQTGHARGKVVIRMVESEGPG